MAKESGYQGWTNYETWAVKLWMDNDPGSQDYWAEAAQEAWDDSNRVGRPWRDARYVLAEKLKDEHEENMPEVSGVYFDLLTAALHEVNWDEIAASLLEEVEDEEEGEDEEDEAPEEE